LEKRLITHVYNISYVARIVSAYAKSKEEPHVVEEEQRYSILAQSKYVLSTHH